MCATVCPSGALTFTTMEEIQRTRSGIPINTWRFGNEIVKTKVYVMVPREVERVDIDLVQLAATPVTLPDDPYDVALMLEDAQ
jgi:ferredoxin